MPNLLDVVVRKRSGTVFNGFLLRVSSKNEVGDFDIYPGHTYFVSEIKDKLTLAKEDGQPTDIQIDKGILHVADNKVEVYLGI